MPLPRIPRNVSKSRDCKTDSDCARRHCPRGAASCLGYGAPSVSDNGQKFVPPVLYCLQKDTADNDSGCVSVQIKHKNGDESRSGFSRRNPVLERYKAC